MSSRESKTVEYSQEALILSSPLERFLKKGVVALRGVFFLLFLISLFFGVRLFSLKQQEDELRKKLFEIETLIQLQKKENQKAFDLIMHANSPEWVEQILLEKLHLIPDGALRIEHGPL